MFLRLSFVLDSVEPELRLKKKTKRVVCDSNQTVVAALISTDTADKPLLQDYVGYLDKEIWHNLF